MLHLVLDPVHVIEHPWHGYPAAAYTMTPRDFWKDLDGIDARCASWRQARVDGADGHTYALVWVLDRAGHVVQTYTAALPRLGAGSGPLGARYPGEF